MLISRRALVHGPGGAAKRRHVQTLADVVVEDVVLCEIVFLTSKVKTAAGHSR